MQTELGRPCVRVRVRSAPPLCYRNTADSMFFYGCGKWQAKDVPVVDPLIWMEAYYPFNKLEKKLILFVKATGT